MTELADGCSETRRPGRPRSTEADRAILDAAIVEYGAHGLNAFTVDAVAARAGVSKATIYRRYPSKVDLVIAAAHECAVTRAPAAPTGDLRADLHGVLERLRTMIDDPTVGRAMRMLVADAHRDEQLHEEHREFLKTKRRFTTQLLEAAVARGELRADLDPYTAAEHLVGPLFYRFLVSGDPITDAYIDHAVDSFLRTYAP
jgi:AcrR family transcriptional regulator